MNRIARLTRVVSMGALLGGLGACSTDQRTTSPEPVLLGSTAQALLGNDIFGSDTLFAAMTDAFAEAPTSTPLVYLGTGSGNGERCIRGQAPPDVCLASPPVQAIARSARSSERW